MHVKMETTVVNVSVKYIRPKYKNLKEWCADPNNVYIGRKGSVFIDKKRCPEHDSIFANPYKINDINNRDQAITLYTNHLQLLIDTNKITKQDLMDLKGKNLGCVFVEENKEVNCHGNIIIDMINKYT